MTPSKKTKKTKEKTNISKLFFRFSFFTALALFIFSAFTLPHKTNTSLPPDTKDTIYVYDTVVYYDTTYVYDTIYKTEKKTTDSIYKFTGKLRYGNIIMQDSDYILIKKNKTKQKEKTATIFY